MPIVKRIFLVLLLPLLPLLLFLLALDFAVLRVAGNPEPIKETLKESGIYTSAVDTFLESTDNPNKDTSGEISPDNPVVQKAFKKAFPPELIENSTENFIDSIYKWLEGGSAVPDFRIDLTQAKKIFINEVAAGAEAQAAKLPACTGGQTEFKDPFSATCLPRGVSPALAAKQIKQELGDNESFLGDPVLTANSFKSADNPSSSAFADNKLPEYYQSLRDSKFVLIGLTLLVLAGIILLSSNYRAGIRHVGIVFLVVGTGLLLAAFMTNKAATEALPDLLARSDNAALTDKLQTLLTSIVRDSNQTLSMFGWGYIIVGTGAVAGSLFIRRGKVASANDNASDTTSESSKAGTKPLGKETDKTTPKSAAKTSAKK